MKTCKNCGQQHNRKKSQFCTLKCTNMYWYIGNKEQVQIRKRQYYVDNKKIIDEYCKQYQKNNKDKIIAYNSQRYQDNKDYIIARNKKYDREHQKQRNATQAKYRATKKSGTLPGYDEELKLIYENCPTGFEVDHIYPLQGKTCWGLHVPWNLQYLTKVDNRKKSNKVEV